METRGSNNNEVKAILSPVQRLLGEDFNPALLLIMIRKSFFWCVIILLVTTSSALIYLRYTPPTYEVNASLIVKSINTAQALDIENNLFQQRNSNLDIEKDIQIMKSNVIIDRVIDSLPLKVSYYRVGNILNEELYKNSPIQIEATVKESSWYDRPIRFRILSENEFAIAFASKDEDDYETFSFNKRYTNPAFDFIATINRNLFAGTATTDLESTYFFTLNSKQTVYNTIRNALIVAPSAPTIALLMRDRKPQKSADIVNKVCEEFIQYDKEKETESASLILDFIESQVDSISNDLREYEDEMTAFKQANGISIGNIEQDLSTQLKELKGKQDQYNFEYSTLEYYRNYFDQYQDSSRLLTGIVDDRYKSLSQNIVKLDELQTELKQLLLKLSPNNPEIINIKGQIEEVKLNLMQSILNSQQEVRKRSAEVDTEIARYLGDYSNVPGIQAEYIRLSRLSDLKEKYYLLLLDKKSAFSITKAGFVSDYTILKKADVPTKPISPNSPLIKLIGLLSGLIACFILIVVRYLLHHKILSVSEITRYSDAGLLGVIPKYLQHMSSSELVVNKNPKSVLSECFRSIRTNMEYVSTKKTEIQLIAVTSTVAGEGKTFIAVNLAGIIAVGGKKVILVDFDLRKPQLHKSFQVNNDKGMSNLITGRSDLAECIRHSEWENLDFITSGPIPPNPAEFIGSKQTDDLISKLKEMYDVVVMDTPPVGIVTDALHLIKQADVPLYVLRADYSSRNFINNVNFLVNDHGISKLSVVLNDMGEGASMYAYNYGYGSGYGYGYGGYGSRSYGYDYYSDETPAKKGFFMRMIAFVKALF